MTGEKKRVIGELAAWHLAGIVSYMPFNAQKLNVQEINPYDNRPPNPLLQRLATLRVNLQWEAMFKHRKY